jgi:hypothetical protein
MERLRHVCGGVVLAALLSSQAGCANTLEAVGGTTAAVGAGTFVVGAQFPSSYDCNSTWPKDRMWCSYGDANGNRPTNAPSNVPVMIAGAALVAAGGVMYFVGRSERQAQPQPPPPPQTPKVRRGDDAEPEDTVLSGR